VSSVAGLYPNFAALAQHETAGVDFQIRMVRAHSTFVVVAPHGGGIEPGTSELARAIAGDTFSFYAFEGLKMSGNGGLHITSTRFDEPACAKLVAESNVVIAIHGERHDADGALTFIGGLEERLGLLIRSALEAKGFGTGQHPDPGLSGRGPDNLCNRGRSSRGVQLELSRGAREAMFESLSRTGRKQTTPRFDDFVAALSGVLQHEARRRSPA